MFKKKRRGPVEITPLKSYQVGKIKENKFWFIKLLLFFGFFMFSMVRKITFSSVDRQLNEAKNEFSQINSDIEHLNSLFDFKAYGIFESSVPNFNISKRINNPGVTLILRNENGEIQNENELGRITDYAQNISFDKTNLNSIYNLKISEKYNYRCLNFVVSNGKEDDYVQLLINIDGEIHLINNYLKIIFYGVIFCIIISGFASLILSTKTLKPIQETLRKQTEFVQNASHELRTPLTIIQAKQELLLQEPNAKIIDKSEDIMLTLNETKRLSKLTKDLMTLLRGSKINLNKEDVNIDEWINSIVTPYTDIAMAQNKKLILNLNFNKDISIDTNKIHQLLVILLDNAIKYTENGDKITISTSLKDNKCIIEVADTGIGISDEGINRIFDRFYREDRARNRETGGSGLGLAIATTIVQAHNGTIKASHNTPKGTVFTIKLNR